MSQLILELGQRPALGREDFLVAPGNEVAVAWIDRWPDWPGPALALHGPADSGKTHLTQVWRAMSGATAIDPLELSVEGLPDALGAARACLLDDAEALIGRGAEGEQALLHLYNLLGERRGHLLLASRRAPALWGVRLADLLSRLKAMPSTTLGAPDDAQLEALLAKLFSDRQLAVKQDVVRYLAARMERSFGAARALVEALDHAALAGQRQVTIPLARAVLGSAAGNHKQDT